MSLVLLSFVHFLVHFCGNNLSFKAGVPCYGLVSGSTGKRPGGRNGVPEMGTRGIRGTEVLAWQRAMYGLERIVCSQQRFRAGVNRSYRLPRALLQPEALSRGSYRIDYSK